MIVNSVLAAITSLFLGDTNLAEGMFDVEGIWPIGAGLHEPPVSWRPLVMVWPAQKLMKLLVDVSEAL